MMLVCVVLVLMYHVAPLTYVNVPVNRIGPVVKSEADVVSQVFNAVPL